MKSAVIKRSTVINGHKTSVSLEDAFWNGLRDIACRRGVSIKEMIEIIDCTRKQNNLSSAIRVFVLSAHRDQIAPAQELGVIDTVWPLAVRR